MDKRDKGMIHVPGPEGGRFHYATQNSMQFKTYELFISGTFQLIFLDWGWPQITKTVESETVDKGELQYSS